MKFINVLLLAASASAVAIDRSAARSTDLEEVSALLARHHAGFPANAQNQNQNTGNNRASKNGNGSASKAKQNGNTNSGATTGATTGNTGNTGSTASGNTLVLKEDGGIPGNECLTFRNNGEIVDAACVNEAADRQITPETLNGASVLRVQRSFTAGFRPDLVGVTACVGFNGTHMRAEDCSASGVELVQFDGQNLVTPSGVCAQGHDDAAQLTVDTNGIKCATYQTTTVTPTAPEK